MTLDCHENVFSLEFSSHKKEPLVDSIVMLGCTTCFVSTPDICIDTCYYITWSMRMPFRSRCWNTLFQKPTSVPYYKNYVFPYASEKNQKLSDCTLALVIKNCHSIANGIVWYMRCLTIAFSRLHACFVGACGEAVSDNVAIFCCFQDWPDARNFLWRIV